MLTTIYAGSNSIWLAIIGMLAKPILAASVMELGDLFNLWIRKKSLYEGKDIGKQELGRQMVTLF